MSGCHGNHDLGIAGRPGCVAPSWDHKVPISAALRCLASNSPPIAFKLHMLCELFGIIRPPRLVCCHGNGQFYSILCLLRHKPAQFRPISSPINPHPHFDCIHGLFLWVIGQFVTAMTFSLPWKRKFNVLHFKYVKCWHAQSMHIFRPWKTCLSAKLDLNATN